VMGVERVCLGGDFTRRLWQAMPPPPEPKDALMPAGLQPGMGIEQLLGPQDYPNLVSGLAARGWADADVTAVTSGNLLRFLRTSLA
jgi:microsomal dipeptidase-like Zn-dependent dipeptidase